MGYQLFVHQGKKRQGSIRKCCPEKYEFMWELSLLWLPFPNPGIYADFCMKVRAGVCGLWELVM